MGGEGREDYGWGLESEGQSSVDDQRKKGEVSEKKCLGAT